MAAKKKKSAKKSGSVITLRLDKGAMAKVRAVQKDRGIGTASKTFISCLESVPLLESELDRVRSELAQCQARCRYLEQVVSDARVSCLAVLDVVAQEDMFES